MKSFIHKFSDKISKSTNSFSKKNYLIDKPWALIDNDGQIQKLIFKKDGGLILSKNGKVTEGKWEYFSEAKSLLIDRVTDKILLKEQFVDDNALLFKKDGTENDFFALANENTVPDYNVPKYIYEVRKVELKMKSISFNNGQVIQIHNVNENNYPQLYEGHDVELVDDEYNISKLNDGTYFSHDQNNSFYVRDSKITMVTNNKLLRTKSDNIICIENGVSDLNSYKYNIGRKIYLNGNPIYNRREIDYNNIIYEIKESVIENIYFLKTYELTNGNRIQIEQSIYYEISKGDKVVSGSWFPIPDGKYRIRGTLKWLNIKENTVT